MKKYNYENFIKKNLPLKIKMIPLLLKDIKEYELQETRQWGKTIQISLRKL